MIGRYEVLRRLGEGGMAVVHLARQTDLQRFVALKELRGLHAEDPAYAQRFLREARLAGSINDPNVVSVYEYLEHDGTPYLAMEYLERGSLRRYVGRMSLEQISGVIEAVTAGLVSAEREGIVHRDLKPENVLLTADGHAKIADFGIAKALGQLQMTELRTATGAIVGTPAYMAPEQVMGQAVTPATDLYATGLIAYELLAGRHPYAGVDAPMALMLCHANDEPRPLGRVREDLPPGIVAWVHAMLARDPADRPASASAAWDWLEGVVAEELGARWRRAAALPEPGETWGYVSVVTTAAPTPPAPDPPSPAPLPAAPDSSPRPRRSRGLSLLATLVATLVLAGAAGLSLFSEDEAPARKGSSHAERVRQELGPALRAGRQVTAGLTQLVPGSDPGAALLQADAALAATRTALANAGVPAARSALRAQVRYLRGVRDTLRLDTDHARLERIGGLSARLVSRLERIDRLVPRASASVGGARKLKAWAAARTLAG